MTTRGRIILWRSRQHQYVTVCVECGTSFENGPYYVRRLKRHIRAPHCGGARFMVLSRREHVRWLRDRIDAMQAKFEIVDVQIDATPITIE